MSPSFLERAQQTADALQVPVEDLLTVMSYETAGTMDPRQGGPTTKWGKHRGLIQFGEDQARRYGADFSSPEAALESQLGPEGAVVKYMLGSGFVPGKHKGIDIYSTINAGSPGRYSASDTAAGGAPGDVYDKWTNQMGGHRKKAREMLGLGEIPFNREASAGLSDVTPSTTAGADAVAKKDEKEAKKYASFADAGFGMDQDRSRFQGKLGRALGLHEGGARDRMLAGLGMENNTANRMGQALAGIGGQIAKGLW